MLYDRIWMGDGRERGSVFNKFANSTWMLVSCCGSDLQIISGNFLLMKYVQGVPKKTLLSEMGEVRIFLNTASCHMDKINRI